MVVAGNGVGAHVPFYISFKGHAEAKQIKKRQEK